MMAKTWSTAGICVRTRSICPVTSLVRATDAPSGSCIEVKKAPWSSSGRNPVGVRCDIPKMPAANIAASMSERLATRSRRRTPPL
ncbi:hypothetical protein ACVWW7_006546 [Bradyrhizobium sp. LM6.9]